jgi:hypothetical protein
MIEYWKGLFGLQLLFRGHGSAVVNGMVPGALAAAVYSGIVVSNDRQPEDFFTHPYAIGVYVGSIAFTIVFRVNNAYGRVSVLQQQQIRTAQRMPFSLSDDMAYFVTLRRHMYDHCSIGKHVARCFK